MRRLLRTGLIAVSAVFAHGLAGAEETNLSVQPLDSRVIFEMRIDDIRVSEISGLAYDPEAALLYAVSDRSRLFAFRLDTAGDDIFALEGMSGQRLLFEDGTRMRDLGFNPEDIAVQSGGALAIVSESDARISAFTTQGLWLKDLTTPEAVADISLQRGENDGLEALRIHPDLGIITAPEEPLEAERRRTHTIYGSNNGRWSYDTDDLWSTSIKALEVLPDGRFLILERDRAEDDSIITFLRLLDPATCPDAGLCQTKVAQIVIPEITDADFEGLAQVSDDLFIIASDDNIDGERRTVFILLRVSLPGQP